jgi:hypothetical protein
MVEVTAAATVVTDTTGKVMEVTHKAPERTSARAIARLVAKQAIRPRTGEQILLQML